MRALVRSIVKDSWRRLESWVKEFARIDSQVFPGALFVPPTFGVALHNDVVLFSFFFRPFLG